MIFDEQGGALRLQQALEAKQVGSSVSCVPSGDNARTLSDAYAAQTLNLLKIRSKEELKLRKSDSAFFKDLDFTTKK